MSVKRPNSKELVDTVVGDVYPLIDRVIAITSVISPKWSSKSTCVFWHDDLFSVTTLLKLYHVTMEPLLAEIISVIQNEFSQLT